eukprot:5431163-Amphidinium_carterae.1
MAHDVQDFVSDAGHRDTTPSPSAMCSAIQPPPCDQRSNHTMEAASAHPLFTTDPTIDTTQHSSPAEHISRTLVQAYADEVNSHEHERIPMQTALDSQSTKTLDEDHSQELEGAGVHLSVDSQSHTTTASYMSDVESCFDVQHGSDMRVDDAAVITGEKAESDHSDLIEFMQSPTQSSQAPSRCDSASQRARVMEDSDDQSDVIDRSLRTRRQMPHTPSEHVEGCSTQTIQRQLPVTPGRRAIVPQPPPPSMAITTPQQPQPARQQ